MELWQDGHHGGSGRPDVEVDTGEWDNLDRWVGGDRQEGGGKRAVQTMGEKVKGSLDKRVGVEYGGRDRQSCQTDTRE